VATDDGASIEVGTRFHPDRDGFVTALRYYAAAAGAGPVGRLYTASGTKLGEVQFPAASAAGWQRAALPSRVPVAAGATYVVSYFSAGPYVSADGFFSAGLDVPPLHAPANAGVFRYGGGFPTESFGASNYWADVEFVRAAADPPPGGGNGDGGSSGSGKPGGGARPGVRPSPRPAPRARVRPRKVRVSPEGLVKLKVTCPGGETGCKVLLRLRRKGHSLASRRFVVGGGGPRTVRLYLSRSLRRKLTRARVLRVTAVASVPDGAGHRTVTRTQIRLLASRGRRR
jgi:hypothetical protein